MYLLILEQPKCVKSVEKKKISKSPAEVREREARIKDLLSFVEEITQNTDIGNECRNSFKSKIEKTKSECKT